MIETNKDLTTMTNFTVSPITLFTVFCFVIDMPSASTLRPRQKGRHFADDTFKHILLNANVRNSIKISLEFVPKDQINNIPRLVKIMTWCRAGDKPLSDPMMISLLTHICVTRPEWVNKRYKWFITPVRWKMTTDTALNSRWLLCWIYIRDMRMYIYFLLFRYLPLFTKTRI